MTTAIKVSNIRIIKSTSKSVVITSSLSVEDIKAITHYRGNKPYKISVSEPLKFFKGSPLSDKFSYGTLPVGEYYISGNALEKSFYVSSNPPKKGPKWVFQSDGVIALTDNVSVSSTDECMVNVKDVMRVGTKVGKKKVFSNPLTPELLVKFAKEYETLLKKSKMSVDNPDYDQLEQFIDESLIKVLKAQYDAYMDYADNVVGQVPTPAVTKACATVEKKLFGKAIEF